MKHMLMYLKDKIPLISLAILSVFISFFLLSGCTPKKGKNKDIPLARVNTKYLYESDLQNIIPPKASKRDSLLIAHSFINKWINTQLLLQQAEKNLPEEKLKFEKQLEDYRNSLITYQYESEYVKQNLDTLVSESEIKHYYQNHLKDFELKENIVKVIYVILDRKAENIKKLEHNYKKILRLPDSILLDSLDRYAPTRSLTYSTDTNTWYPFNEVIKVIPIETYNQGIYLKNHRIIYLKGENKIYLVKFVNFKIKDEISPIDLESVFIKSIILNKRKKQLIARLRKQIFKEAAKQKEFEIY